MADRKELCLREIDSVVVKREKENDNQKKWEKVVKDTPLALKFVSKGHLLLCYTLRPIPETSCRTSGQSFHIVRP